MQAMRDAIEQIAAGKDLNRKQAKQAMKELMSGSCPHLLTSAFLIGLKLKGESIQEITALAEVMREKSIRINPRLKSELIDVCGTGGASLKTFNISTISAFVIAGAGCQVAKHGNRSHTSKSGSADLLEALGANLEADPKTIQSAIEEIGIGFLYAPNLHPAMKYAVPVRKALKIRTVFNILGPLTNPARATCHLMGVFDPELVDKFPQVLKNLGVNRCLVAHGAGGMDEISTLGKTYLGELKEGKIRHYTINPRAFGFNPPKPELIRNLPPRESAQLAIRILKNEIKDGRLEIVLLNAGAGIYTTGKASSIEGGIQLAEESIKSGAAYGKLMQFIQKTGGNLKV